MSDQMHPPGKITIDLEVLNTIARLATLSVPGVSHLSKIPGSVNRIFKSTPSEGVDITVENNTVYADIYVIILKDHNVREISRNIQTQISRSFSEMVGMDVGKVNIHVEDIDYSTGETIKTP